MIGEILVILFLVGLATAISLIFGYALFFIKDKIDRTQERIERVKTTHNVRRGKEIPLWSMEWESEWDEI